MKLLENLKAGCKMAPQAFNNPEDNMYSIGIQSKGQNSTPEFLKKIGCISIFSVPIVGGAIGIINAISVQGYEHIIPVCAGTMGLILFGV